MSHLLGLLSVWVSQYYRFEEETWGGVHTAPDGLSFARLLGAWWGGISPGVVSRCIDMHRELDRTRPSVARYGLPVPPR